MDVNKSEIQSFFKGKNVFLTGATGFLGKILLEKLLRTCLIEKVYILVRPKKEKLEDERYKEIFDVPLFERIRKEQPDFRNRVILVAGDCAQPNLGIEEQVKSNLTSNINIIFHCAATVRFDQKLRTAAYINVRATRDLLAWSKEMKNLEAFIYVSTAYSNCPKTAIDEVFYEPRISADKLMRLLDEFDDDFIEGFTPSLLGKWPNTYTFTKSISEDAVKRESIGIPVAVVRPSIIISTYKDPVKGWIDNYYGPVGISLAGGLGLIRTMYVIPEHKNDMVPADYVINATITAAWDLSKNANTANGKKVDVYGKSVPMIYNIVSTSESPLDNATYYKLGKMEVKKIPSPLGMWYVFGNMNRYKWKYTLESILLHWIPAYIIDFIAICLRKKPMLVDGYHKLDKFLDFNEYFVVNQWSFSNYNTQALWKKLKTHDKELFEFSMKEFSWKEYFPGYARGIRMYLLKDPLETVPAGQRKAIILKIAHYTTVGLLLVGLYFLIFMLVSKVGGLYQYICT